EERGEPEADERHGRLPLLDGSTALTDVGERTPTDGENGVDGSTATARRGVRLVTSRLAVELGRDVHARGAPRRSVRREETRADPEHDAGDDGERRDVHAEAQPGHVVDAVRHPVDER